MGALKYSSLMTVTRMRLETGIQLTKRNSL